MKRRNRRRRECFHRQVLIVQRQGHRARVEEGKREEGGREIGREDYENDVDIDTDGDDYMCVRRRHPKNLGKTGRYLVREKGRDGGRVIKRGRNASRAMRREGGLRDNIKKGYIALHTDK